ncbi:asparaginase [Stutzerimonas kunmingensis]|uniref:asparaginase n=1 Tax=Stutzerimonas kunmingensis TaxID=1211807 RepID=UPI000CE4E304|nr:asparaginase [Stutzerimonas kunmingensis]
MNQSIERLLVLYTGGTIGMQQSAAGLMPASGFEARLRAQQALEAGPLPSWTFRELQPLLDSANMQPTHWLQMASAVRDAVAQGDCDAVLLLHGTDTLAYSAAALSFLLLDIEIPVLLTGAMLPAGSPGSDAWPNLFGAMRALQAGQVQGVQLYFNGALLHGARVSKLRSDAFDAFAEAPRQRLANATAERAPALLPQRSAQVMVLPLYPGVGAAQVQSLVASGAQALLLECYGSGTGPADDVDFIAALRQAHRQGVVLAAISQCPGGHVDFDVYATGSGLRDAGLISGGGMTREAALGKLFALLAAGLDQAQVEHWFGRDLCGEMAG